MRAMTQRSRWQIAIVVVTAALRLAAAAWSAPTVMPDSERYRNDTSPLLPFNVWDGNGPGVLAQVVNLLPLSTAVLVQTALTVTLWGAAAVYAASLTTGKRSWVTFLLIHAWSLSPWFLLWDTWVLTEALTLAGCALTAVGIGAARPGARSGYWVTVIGLAVAVATRPFVGAMLLPIVALIFVWPLSVARLRALIAPLAAAVVLAVFATWQALTFTAADSSPFSYLPEPESLATVQATDRLAGRGHLPGYLDLARDAGMPPCPEAEAIAVAALTDNDKLTMLRSITDCPDLDAWLEDGGLPWTREFTHNTSATVAELVSPSYWLTETFVGYMPSDDRLRSIRELSRTRWDELVVAINATMLLATAAAVLAVLLRAPGQRMFFAAAVTVVCAVSVYAWGSDGLEYWRHLLPAFPILLPLAVTLLARAAPRDPA